jgi:hypothetical protein
MAGRALNGGIAVLGDASSGGGTAGVFNGAVAVYGTVTTDGLDCTGCVSPSDLGRSYIAGGGQATTIAATVTKGNSAALAAPGSVAHLDYFCSNPTTGQGSLTITDPGNTPITIFIDNGNADPVVTSLANSDTWYSLNTRAAGEFLIVQVQGVQGVLEAHIAIVHAANDCHVQGQAFFTQP